MVEVNSAFNFDTRILKLVSLWMQNSNLIWMHRLMSESGRLQERFFVTNAAITIGTIMKFFIKGQKTIHLFQALNLLTRDEKQQSNLQIINLRHAAVRGQSK